MKQSSPNSEKLELLLDLLHHLKTRHPLSLLLFFGLVSNLIFAPAIYAATGSDIPQKTAYALGLLGLVTVALSIYLFFVIFQPEKF
ncbi:K(+)-transporting ATPase subunit F [Aphanothece hegewaldii CCALA 016]|uniref:K(+)-transporting ATPase subunit F n=1 Tax=Aphanothece hegewaldii CCALA 016 TaxID=2107694 RepID=A0A2T1M0M7_9CHRO|nr:K(+)-transporting ATPase subunit F [Aphanothece hegewaldii]PSF38224.1 K(+)-transporting ATPase subunit F [Aphanothece hegewaldii CCALA 016]